MDLEGWAQHSTLSQDEYEILKIEENKLFQIIPKSGVLKSNQRQVIKMVYSHNMIGQYSFPVILDIHGGRQIPFRLSGITLSETDKYLNFAGDQAGIQTKLLICNILILSISILNFGLAMYWQYIDMFFFSSDSNIF